MATFFFNIIIRFVKPLYNASTFFVKFKTISILNFYNAAIREVFAGKERLRGRFPGPCIGWTISVQAFS